MRKRAVAIPVATFFVGVLIAPPSPATSGETKTETVTVTVTPAAIESTTKTAKTTKTTKTVKTWGSGTYLVGTEIPTGTYRTDGPADSNCYLETSSKSGDINVNEWVTDEGESAYIVITPRDHFFKVSGCQPLKRTSH